MMNYCKYFVELKDKVILHFNIFYNNLEDFSDFCIENRIIL
jgi:hypothetical protein